MSILSLVFRKEVRVRYKLKMYLKLNNKLRGKIEEGIYTWLYDSLYIKNSIIIGKNSCISQDIQFPHIQNIVIGEGVHISKNCKIFQDVTIGQNKGKYPKIGAGVIIYPGAKIIGNVMIGDNVIIGANSVVNRSVETNNIVAGNPARIIGKRKDTDVYY